MDIVRCDASWVHAGDADGYRIYFGTQLVHETGPIAAASFEVQMESGDHTFEIEPYNAFGAGPRVAVTVTYESPNDVPPGEVTGFGVELTYIRKA
jgi:hypothetical protein